MHGFHGRVLADVPVDGRRIIASVRVRRRCAKFSTARVSDVPRADSRVVERYQHRTNRLTNQPNSVVKELAGRAGARLCRVLSCAISRSTAPRMLMRQMATPLRVPPVLGVDDLALKRRHRYATSRVIPELGAK